MARSSTRRVAGVAVMVLCAMTLIAQSASGQTVTSLFDGVSLAGWTTEGTTASAADGMLTVHRGAGWVRHQKVFANFRLTMDVRLIGTGARGGIYVRGWPTFDEETSVPNNAFRIDFKNDVTAALSPTEVAVWQRVDIVCNGRTLTVRVNDRELLKRDDLRNPQGFVAMGVQGGTAEFRRIEISAVRPEPTATRREDSAGAVRSRVGITLPRPIKEAKPRYTAEAMRAKISGAVLLEAVVLADGTVGNVEVVQSLDPLFGLDQNAIRAVKQWRFEPGTRDGTPVAVLVTVEMTYTLK
jgi:TonB family protein